MNATDHPFTITILGYGNVGATIGSLLLNSLARPMHLNVMEPAGTQAGTILDTAHTISLLGKHAWSVNREDLIEKSDIIIHTAGVGAKIKNDRMEVLEGNVRLTETLFKGRSWQTDPWIIVVTNPVDVISYYTWQFSGLPAGRIIGTGTMLDSTRLAYYLATKLGLSPLQVHGMVAGEHGANMVPLYSQTTIDNQPILHTIHQDAAWYEAITQQTMHAAREIKQTQDATYYGIATCVMAIVKMILNGENVQQPLSCLLDSNYQEKLQCQPIYMSLPVEWKADRINFQPNLELLDAEWEALERAAQKLAAIL